jgi:hypothetical protein
MNIDSSTASISARLFAFYDSRSHLNKKKGIKWTAFPCAMAISVVLCGCSSILPPNTGPALNTPWRLIPLDEEIAQIKSSVTEAQNFEAARNTTEGRNAYVTERMYAIDLEYTKYETDITTATASIGLFSSLVNLGLTGTASVLNVPQTNKILSAIATGVTGGTQAFDKDVLLSQAIQNLETQMRTDRNNQAKIIVASMDCSIEQYPLGMALSDLEAYYRAGTVPSAEVTISRTVSKAEETSKNNKDSVSPAKAIASPAQAQLKTEGQATQTAATVSRDKCPRST